jgi:hypothetical protein
MIMRNKWIPALVCLTCIAVGVLFSSKHHVRADEADEVRKLQKESEKQVEAPLRQRQKTLDEARKVEISRQQNELKRALAAAFKRLENLAATKPANEEEEKDLQLQIEYVKAKVEILKQQIKRANDPGHHEHGDDGHHEHGDHHGHEHGDHDHDLQFDRHLQQLHAHKGELEVQGAEIELSDRLMKVASNPHLAAAWGIRKASQALPPEEALEFLSELAETTDDKVIVSLIRMRIAELHEAMGNADGFKQQLRVLIRGK